MKIALIADADIWTGVPDQLKSQVNGCVVSWLLYLQSVSDRSGDRIRLKSIVRPSFWTHVMIMAADIASAM